MDFFLLPPLLATSVEDGDVAEAGRLTCMSRASLEDTFVRLLPLPENKHKIVSQFKIIQQNITVRGTT